MNALNYEFYSTDKVNFTLKHSQTSQDSAR
jgi:hypothetical protein